MKLVIGSDHAGFLLKEEVRAYLSLKGHEIVDLGVHSTAPSDYPDAAEAVGDAINAGVAKRGILICGSGLGMCIAANKIPGVRAAPCYDDVTAELSRRHNDLNILCLSGDMLGSRLLDRIVEIWLKTPFDGGRHARRLAKIAKLESRTDRPE